MEDNVNDRFRKAEFRSEENEQKINWLSKRLKNQEGLLSSNTSSLSSHSSRLTSLETNINSTISDISELEGRTTVVETGVSTLGNRVTVLEGSTGGSGGETIGGGSSYCRDRKHYYGTCTSAKYSNLRGFYFSHKANSLLKMILKFEICSTQAVDVTYGIEINGEDIRSETVTFGIETKAFSFTYDSKMEEEQNFLRLHLVNTAATSASEETRFQNISLELEGEEVKIWSWDSGFSCVPTPSSFAFIHIDPTKQHPQIAYLQASTSTNISTLQDAIFSTTRTYTLLTPLVSHKQENSGVWTFSSCPGAIVRIPYNAQFRETLFSEISTNPTVLNSYSSSTCRRFTYDTIFSSPILNNEQTYSKDFCIVKIDTPKVINFRRHNTTSDQTITFDDLIVQMDGIARVGDTSATAPEGVVLTTIKGKMFFAIFSMVTGGETLKFEIGDGENAHAIATSNGIVLTFLRNGHVFKKRYLFSYEGSPSISDSGDPEVDMGEFDECWLSSEARIMRDGHIIKYFPLSTSNIFTSTLQIYDPFS